MDWTITNDFGPEEHFSDYGSLETDGNNDYRAEQQQSHQQDSNQSNSAIGDNRASSSAKQTQSYAKQMDDASKALAMAFHDAQRLPQTNSFAPSNSERHFNPQNHFLLGLGSHDSSHVATNSGTSINNLFSDTRQLLNGVQQSKTQQQLSSRDQNYGLHDGSQQYAENVLDAAFPPRDARNLTNSLGSHVVHPDRNVNNDNFSQLWNNSHQLQPYSNANNVLDNLLGGAVNAQNLVGAPGLHLVRNENSVTDGSHVSSLDFSRSASSSHPSAGETRGQFHPTHHQPGGFDGAARSSFKPAGELRTNFIQAQNQSNVFFPDHSSHGSINSRMTPPAFNGYTNQKQNQQKQNSKQMSRNEREQQRAAKISGVIDKLRNTMVQGGWKVEMKSKYQVLSTSAEYLRHLIQVTKEKESELVKTKEEFAIRNQKLDEDRALQDGSTDDSLTSSLTQSFTGTHSVDERWKGKFGNGDSSTDVAVASVSPGRDSSKRKMPNEWSDEGEIASKKEKNGDDDSNHGSNSSGNLDSNNIISVHKMSSSLSDVTDSNRCSSDGQGTNGSSDGQGGAGGKEIKASFDLSVLAMAESDTSKTAENSVSTTGAVVSGEDELSGEHKHTSIVFTKDRKRTYSEKTSMDEDFHLSYQEIFLASNVPQLIATPSGRIVACNDFFFRVTGLTEKDVKKVTIFSMVQVDHLSALFELVAEALRTSNTHDVSNTSSTESSSKPSSITDSNLTSNCASSNDNSQDTRDKNSDSGTEEKEPSIEPLQFETVTLPCVSFPNVLNNEKDGRLKNLYMNVTFMYDVNPLKRCIHCALTDQPGARGKIGNITPELLTMVFPSDS